MKDILYLNQQTSMDKWQPWKRKRIPVVKQLTGTDCGAACLCMVMAHFGREEELDDVRNRLKVGRDGAKASDIVKTAAFYKLRGKGFRLEQPEQLKEYPPGTIIHWQLCHYVVLESVNKLGAFIVDPAVGRRFVDWEELNECFSGIILTFEKTSEFSNKKIVKNVLTKQRIFSFFTNYRNLVFQVVLASLLIQSFTLAIPIFTSLIIDDILPFKDADFLNAMMFMGAVLCLMLLVGSLSRGYLLLKLRVKLDSYLSSEFIEHMLALPLKFFMYRSSGDLVMRLNSNNEMREILTTTTLTSLIDGTLACSYLLLIFIFDWRMGMLVSILASFRVIIFWVSKDKQEALMSSNLETQARSRSFEFQMISNITTIKANGTTDFVMNRWQNLFFKNLSVAAQQQKLDTLVNAAQEFLALASPISILIFGAYLVLNSQSTLGAMFGINALSIAFLIPFSNLINAALQLKSLNSYMERLEDVFKEPRESFSDKISLQHFKGKIEVKDISFSYDGDSKPTIEDINLEIEAGSFVAIVGPSGSGKSTLISLLSGLHNSDSGSILIDGINSDELNMDWFRTNIGYVPQNPSFFDGTMENNIRLYHPDITFQQINHSLTQAVFNEEVENMPQGINTFLSDGGNSISAGQRQRLALAIALANKPKIIFMDEATSALDAVTENKVQKNLEQLQCTRVVISHRLSTIIGADNILVMSNGKLVESGKHDELMSKKGHYHQLFSAQFK